MTYSRQKMCFKLAALAVTLLAMTPYAGTAAAATGDCWSRTEMVSSQVRELQTKMMVAALQCRTVQGSSILANYNTFVRRFRTDITKHNDVLKKRFLRLYGARGERAFDSYTTQLANSYGAEAAQADFCTRMEQNTQEVVSISDSELASVAQHAIAVPEGVCVN